MGTSLEYRIRLLAAAQRELWKLQQQFTDEAKRRKLTEAALEALKFHERRKAAQ